MLPGEVYSISTKVGYGFIQFIAKTSLGTDLVRILDPVKPIKLVLQSEVDLPERYSIEFVLNAAKRRKLVEMVGSYKIPLFYRPPVYARAEHNVRGGFQGWHIVHRESLQRQQKLTLSLEELNLSPHGIPNDTLLKEWLETDWRLSNWNR